VRPPWDGKRTCKNASAKWQKTVAGALADAVAIAVAKPRAAYAPRSCSRTFARRRNCDFSDVHTHIYRSGGREPAVARGTALATALPQLLASLPTVY